MTGTRQPIHVVYGGAQLFRADTAAKLAEKARAAWTEHDRSLSWTPAVHERVKAKLQREAVEDFRIDFEDGFGVRSPAEEDEAAAGAARELAIGLAQKGLPPFIGIRVKALAAATRSRAVRTLELFFKTLMAEAKRAFPEAFFVTFPKIERPEEVTEAVQLLVGLETQYKIKLRLEIMIETPPSILGLQALVAAGGGRIAGAHFGAYDFTASLGIASSAQSLNHPACDAARMAMLLAFAGSGVALSDGATTLLPVGTADAVKRAWEQSRSDIQRSLRQGFYQGWDLHPAQIPVRYATVYDFFLSGLPAARERLKNFTEREAQATLTGAVFDDAATGRGLKNFFARAKACGAILEDP